MDLREYFHPIYAILRSMEKGISYDRSEESLAAKTRWFQTLSEEERLAYFNEVTEIALQNDPDLPNKKSARSITGRIKILTLE